MEALHAVTVRQLDRVVRTKKRVESFLSPEAYKEYFRRVRAHGTSHLPLSAPNFPPCPTHNTHERTQRV
jgi:hypothetical protein